MSNPVLIMVRGVPGSGKSYLTTKLQESIGKENVVVLDPDTIDQTSQEYTEFSKALAAEDVNPKLHPYRFLRSKAYESIISHKIIIWNQAFIDLDGFGKTVKNLQTFASEHSTRLPLLVVEVEINGDTAQERVAKRVAQGGHNVADEAFTRFISQYESFAEKGYDTVVVNGEDDVATSAATVLRALAELQKS